MISCTKDKRIYLNPFFFYKIQMILDKKMTLLLKNIKNIALVFNYLKWERKFYMYVHHTSDEQKYTLDNFQYL